jgi:hypothetical protein
MALFNVQTDPQELAPLARFMPDLVLKVEILRTLWEVQSLDRQAWKKFSNHGTSQYIEFDADVLERLKGLGYVN